MIIHSMSRKTASFGELITYIDRGASSSRQKPYMYVWNLFGSDHAAMTVEFEENSRLVKRRRNGNRLYHEVVSLRVSNAIPLEQQYRMLHDLVGDYIRMRAPGCLVYGRLHTEHQFDPDNPHIHFHLVVSANEVGKSRRHWLSRKDFGQIQRSMEAYVLQRYPELDQPAIFTKPGVGKNRARGRIKHHARQYERRTGRKSRKRLVQEVVLEALEVAGSREQLDAALSQEGFALYHRRKHTGVRCLEDGRKYTFGTLEVEAAFAKRQEFWRNGPSADSDRSNPGSSDIKEFGNLTGSDTSLQGGSMRDRFRSNQNRDLSKDLQSKLEKQRWEELCAMRDRQKQRKKELEKEQDRFFDLER
ncbi:hypothetical protein SCOR_27540 [Sulfidibacter corallicola]|uniref:Relaxase/mobilization nuclease domain-containing protein n=1 Tax=Sulfidibacter corallicola TaxID=2818388 RepID=A0A8A4TL10_SULCO|nr:relaxase/mobilization nuclease domain-containing protein [Sulfidibacter corallicola]QTD50689.1 hypothetical protein J3U87_34315 [Sulfidibacter corallicola]